MQFASQNTKIASCLFFAVLILSTPISVFGQFVPTGYIATTSVITSICGDLIVGEGEECDVSGETGAYSTTIIGRQCNSAQCQFGPYCGDAILQTAYGESCDDGNNIDLDFCSALCITEPAASGGGGSSGGGGGGGGSTEDLGDTQVSVTGRGYPGQLVHVLLDAKEVGTVRANNLGAFDFATNASPGTVSMGFWSLDVNKVKSITYSTTFDVTQGAITNVNSVLIPPTISVDKASFNAGETVTLSGQTIPNTTIEVTIDAGAKVLSTVSGSNGVWSIPYNTTGLSNKTHTARARFIISGNGLTTQSSFSSTLQLSVGVGGQAATPSDLNRDGSINLTDFSILIFWWGKDGGNSDPKADINGNGKVGLEDFSILLFNWTG